MAGKAERLDNTSLEMRKGRGRRQGEWGCVGGEGGGGRWQGGRGDGTAEEGGKKLGRWMKVPGKLLGNGVLEGDGKQWRKRGRYRVPRKRWGRRDEGPL